MRKPASRSLACATCSKVPTTGLRITERELRLRRSGLDKEQPPRLCHPTATVQADHRPDRFLPESGLSGAEVWRVA